MLVQQSRCSVNYAEQQKQDMHTEYEESCVGLGETKGVSKVDRVGDMRSLKEASGLQPKSILYLYNIGELLDLNQSMSMSDEHTEYGRQDEQHRGKQGCHSLVELPIDSHKTKGQNGLDFERLPRL
jgi:hypothetical protein